MAPKITYIVYLLIRIRISQMKASPIYHWAKFFKNWVKMEKKIGLWDSVPYMLLNMPLRELTFYLLKFEPYKLN